MVRHTQKPIKPQLINFLLKLRENMCQMNLNSHAKFHGDRTIDGAITVKKADKNIIFV